MSDPEPRKLSTLQGRFITKVTRDGTDIVFHDARKNPFFRVPLATIFDEKRDSFEDDLK